MKLLSISLENYKCFERNTTLEIAPLTVIVGRNNSGKSALLKAVHLFSTSILQSNGVDPVPLNLHSNGIHHGKTFRDLISGRTSNGVIQFTALMSKGSEEIELSVKIQNVLRSSNTTKYDVCILFWSIKFQGHFIEVTRDELNSESSYRVTGSSINEVRQPITWKGLLPERPNQLPDWVNEQVDCIKAWAKNVHYLQSPRIFRSSGLNVNESISSELESIGAHTPFILANSDSLQNSVNAWYSKVFGTSISVRKYGEYFDLIIGNRTHGLDVLLEQSGEGLIQILTIAIKAFSSNSDPWIDIIEHPESDLHPGAHGVVADLLVESLSDHHRSLIIETHSEMMLLRIRRWIIEKKLKSSQVVIYWIHPESSGGSTLKKITINERGELSSWPEGVFTEDYEEVLAIRRALRRLDE